MQLWTPGWVCCIVVPTFMKRLICQPLFAALLWIAACVVIPFAWSQQTTISANVKVVDVVATVRDKKGAIVKNLGKDDFRIEEDGKPQTIKYFRQDADLPLTLGLLVDTSQSQRAVMDQERTASYAFLDKMLREKDLAFLIHFDREVELMQDVTASRPKLQKALDELQTPQFRQANSPSNDPDSDSSGQDRRGGRGGQRAGGGTALYDAVFLSSDEVMSKQKERKALIILSDGVDRGSKVSLERAIESAQRANVVVYSIYYAGRENNNYGDRDGQRRGGGSVGFPGGGYPGGGRRGGGYPGGGGGGGRQRQQEPRVDGKKILERLSGETGGRMFEVTKKETVDAVYSQIEEDLRNQYSLGYTPTTWIPGYHKLQLTSDKKDVRIQARTGYYAAE